MLHLYDSAIIVIKGENKKKSITSKMCELSKKYERKSIVNTNNR